MPNRAKDPSTFNTQEIRLMLRVALSSSHRTELDWTSEAVTRVLLSILASAANANCNEHNSPMVHFMHLYYTAAEYRSWTASVSELILRLVPGKVHPALGDPWCAEPFLTEIV